MLRRLFPLGLMCMLGVLTFLPLTYTLAQAQLPPINQQIQPNTPQLDKALQPNLLPNLPPKVQISDIALVVGAACSGNPDLDCAHVKWTLQPPPSDLSGFTYEVKGQMTYESGSSNSATNPPPAIKEGKINEALVRFFHSGSGLTKSVTMTVKLFKTVNGAKQLVSEQTQAKNF